MNRYKRGWFSNNVPAVAVNLYKNDKGEVFISWEGDYERVYPRWDVEHKEYVWTFDDDGLDSSCGEREATPEEYDNPIRVTLKYKYVDGALIEPVFMLIARGVVHCYILPVVHRHLRKFSQ